MKLGFVKKRNRPCLWVEVLTNPPIPDFPGESWCCCQGTSLVWNCLNEVRTGEKTRQQPQKCASIFQMWNFLYFEKWNWSEQWENKHISTYHCSVSIQIFTFTWKDKKSNNLCLCFKWMHPPWYWQALNIASKIAKLRKWRNPRWNLLLLHIYYSSQTSILGKSHKTHFVY